MDFIIGCVCALLVISLVMAIREKIKNAENLENRFQRIEKALFKEEGDSK